MVVPAICDLSGVVSYLLAGNSGALNDYEGGMFLLLSKVCDREC